VEVFEEKKSKTLSEFGETSVSCCGFHGYEFHVKGAAEVPRLVPGRL
jgi:hypothetical protein